MLLFPLASHGFDSKNNTGHYKVNSDFTNCIYVLSKIYLMDAQDLMVINNIALLELERLLFENVEVLCLVWL